MQDLTSTRWQRTGSSIVWARFLVADSVGLGKTIETALILRELASRGELTRALMVVPAGLVENWRRELNDTFHLDFEVFGSEGDVTDRKSNAFAKHNRLIASIDTLKRPARSTVAPPRFPIWSTPISTTTRVRRFHVASDCHYAPAN